MAKNALINRAIAYIVWFTFSTSYADMNHYLKLSLDTPFYGIVEVCSVSSFGVFWHHVGSCLCPEDLPSCAVMLVYPGLDGKVKIWDVYKNQKCMCTYLGHTKGVRDINFTNDGSKFVSVGYDKNIRLWDTETGQVKCKLPAGWGQVERVM
jgi:WD40 repeat protein